MRRLFFAIPVLFLTACDIVASDAPHPVDPALLGPPSGKEQALMVAADGARRNGDTASAERDYLEAVGVNSGHVEAHLALADLYQSEHQLEKAQPILLRAHGYQPHQPRVDYLLGKIAIMQNRPDQALAFFNEGITAEPDNIDLLNGAGTAYDMLRQNDAAQRTYQRAIAMHPTEDLSMVRNNLAMSYLLSNQPKKAAALLKTEMKKPGASAVTRHNLALAYGILGKNTEAKALVSKDMTEEERQLVIKRLRAYLAQPQTTTPPLAAVAPH